jgi:hypothetical protein
LAAFLPTDASTNAIPLERSPALLYRVNEVMREGRRGQNEPERIPFFCECRRADCYAPVWLTADAYDQRRSGSEPSLVSPSHELARGRGEGRLGKAG